MVAGNSAIVGALDYYCPIDLEVFMKEKCRNGHRLNEKTVYTFTHKNGKVYNFCRTCKSAANKRRYYADEVFREKVKGAALARYHRLANRTEINAG
jgi:hypothetical protein